MFYTTKILPLLDSLRIGALAYNLFAPRGQFHQVKREEGGKMSTFEEEKDSLEVDKALSRRAFLKGGATVGAVAALGGVTLAGCTPSSQQSESTTTTPTGTTDVAAGPDADRRAVHLMRRRQKKDRYLHAHERRRPVAFRQQQHETAV